MKITHPVKGYSGHVQVGSYGLHFLAGVTHAKAKDIDGKVRASLVAQGFLVEDDRPGRGADTPDDDATPDAPAE